MLFSTFFSHNCVQIHIISPKIIGKQRSGHETFAEEVSTCTLRSPCKLFLLRKNQRDILKMRSTKEELKLESNCIEFKKLNLSSWLCEYLTKYWFLLNTIFMFIVRYFRVFIVTWLFLLSFLRFVKMLSSLSILPTLWAPKDVQRSPWITWSACCCSKTVRKQLIL